jgi:hypothetical protein
MDFYGLNRRACEQLSRSKMENCEKQMQPGLKSVATGQTDFIAI